MTQPLGPVMLDLEGTTVSRAERELLMRPAVGGVILFARNIADAAQVGELCASLRQIRPDLLLGIDQEGGRVQRLREGVTRLPSMARLGRCYVSDPSRCLHLCQEAGWLLGMEMAACGLDLSFAPVLDVDAGLSSVIGDRSFSADPHAVATMGRAFIDGLHEAGMVAVGKHFPGHGGTAADSHTHEVVDERPLQALRAHDLIPFAELAGRLDGIMPGHVVYPAFDARPAGYSPSWLGLLREELGFKGTIFSDDLSMAAAHTAGDPAARALQALDAGCDMVLVCNDRDAARAVIEACAGRASKRPAKLRYGRARPGLDTLTVLSRWRKAHAQLEALVDEPADPAPRN
ncbi:beta-N-acetylhexosaminidase [Modicisalibacter zincidurans]|uniref:Beta-hexosaminidase n=1 Tax=Modicisalibacter zincidurans TaxID=1178777 RepID=A0ABP9QY94_9GAMM|nr:beta-N-acetylhexosaminidase [Halomonas zincidurans]